MGMENMLTIVQVEALESGMHRLQAQSNRGECWLDGWIAVPKDLEDAIWDCGGWCSLTLEGQTLMGITPTQRPPLPEPEPSEANDVRSMIVDHEMRLVLLELGLSEGEVTTDAI